jgi:uncharacterized protein (AIM24 family)
VEIGVTGLTGVFRRLFAGMPLIMTQAKGPGRIAFSRDGVGHVFAMHMEAGHTLDVRRGQWLAATHGIDYSFYRARGIANLVFGNTGIFIDTFSCGSTAGILWLHGFGNVFEVVVIPRKSRQ